MAEVQNSCHGEPVEPWQQEKRILRQAQDDTYRMPRTPDLGRKILRTVAFVGSLVTAVLAGERLARAQASEPFGDDINAIRPTNTAGEARVRSGHLMPGVLPHRFRLTFSALQPDQSFVASTDIYAKEFEIDDSADGGIIIRGLGPVSGVLTNPDDSEASCLEINRPDGRVTVIADLGGGSNINVDGSERWDADGTCDGGFVETTPGFHPTTTPGELKINAHFPTPNTCAFCDDNNVWRVNIDEPDFCHAIEDAVLAADAAGQNPYQADLLNSRESANGPSEISSPETDRLLAVTRTAGGPWLTFLIRRNPDEDPWAAASLTHLQRNPDGTWTPQPSQTPVADPLGTRAWSLLKRTTPSGREVTLFVYNDMNPDTDEPILKVLALEESSVTPGTFLEVPITMEETADEPDDDGDGRVGSEDDCRWRANPGGVDVSGPAGVDVSDGKEDACQANCEAGGWPGVDAPGATNASGLRVCSSELGYANAFTDEDGSTFHSNADVVLAPDGAIALSPGQTIRYIHSKDPRVAEIPSRDIKFPDGNSVHVKLNNTQHLNGDPGTATLTRRPYEGYDPLAAPVTVNFDGPTAGVIDYPPAVGAVLGLEGSDVEVSAGEENLPMICPPICAPGGGDGGPGDGGPGDAGPGGDAGSGDGPPVTCPPTCPPDAGSPDANPATCPPTCPPDASTPDASGPDATTPDASSPDANTDTPDSGICTQNCASDAGKPDGGTLTCPPECPPDSGPDRRTPDARPEPPDGERPDGQNQKADAGKGGNGGGCGCEVPGKNQNSSPFNAAPIILTAAGLAGLSHRRRKKSSI